MLLEDHVKQKTLAHAYFITGDAKTYIEKLFSAPLFDVLSYNKSIGIDEVRNILYRVSFASTQEKRQIVVLHAGMVGREAKSALLKIIEEPPPYTHFILYGVSKKALPQALASRLLDGGHIPYEEREGYGEKADMFLSADGDPKKRETILQDVADTESLALFLSALEQRVRSKHASERMVMLERIQTARAFLSHPIPMVASIKEYLSLLV